MHNLSPMPHSRIILGPAFTEKTERLKGQNVFTIRVANDADKLTVKRELERLYDVRVDSVRVIRVPSKTRLIARGRTMEKRKPWKKMFVTLSSESKPLDLAAFR